MKIAGLLRTTFVIAQLIAAGLSFAALAMHTISPNSQAIVAGDGVPTPNAGSERT